MTKVRIFALLTTLFIVGTVATLVSLYARGYRFDYQNAEFAPNGLLVIKSAPDSAQVFINGELETATNATIPLNPNVYDIRVEKEGYIPWSRRLQIEKEVVTEATAHLFKTAPSLSAITFTGSLNPTPSRDLTKIAYVVPPSKNSGNGQDDASGLWIMEMLNLPLGFARDPRRITDGDLSDATWIWSPDGREILLTTKTGVYLLPTSDFTSQSQRINVSQNKEELLVEWEKEKNVRFKAQINKLPDELETILERKASSVVLSPDEDMVLYTASGSAKIPIELIKPVPGASTQKEERELKLGNTYIYDIKEDRNFLIDENTKNLIIEGGTMTEAHRRMSWFPTSRHLILAEDNRVVIMDYDGTNRQTVYQGSYVSPQAFPTLSLDRLIILTTLGAEGAIPNLYSLGIK